MILIIAYKLSHDTRGESDMAQFSFKHQLWDVSLKIRHQWDNCWCQESRVMRFSLCLIHQLIFFFKKDLFISSKICSRFLTPDFSSMHAPIIRVGCYSIRCTSVFDLEGCKASQFCSGVYCAPAAFWSEGVGSVPVVRWYGAEAGFVRCVPTHASPHWIISSHMLYEIIEFWCRLCKVLHNT